MMKYIIIFLNFVILLFNFLSCDKDKEENIWGANVRFVDSTYVREKEIYKIGEIIYVIASESFGAKTPNTAEILIESGIGDYEIIKAPLNCIPHIPLIRVHCGYIYSNATGSITQKNGIIEVHPKGDTLWAIYTINRFKAVDNTYIIQ